MLISFSSFSRGQQCVIHEKVYVVLRNAEQNAIQQMSWQVYMLRCSDNSLYTGITTDVERRLSEHNGKTSGGARYTRGRRPVVMIYAEECESRSAASKRELQIKQLSRNAKLALLNTHTAQVAP